MTTGADDDADDGAAPIRDDEPTKRHTGVRERSPSPGASSGAAARARVPDESWIGRELDGRYRIVSILGHGGMGAVYEAEHLKLLKRVALKVVHQDLAGVGDVAVRFAREATASARLDHPHVAAAIDYGSLPEGGAYLVMQLVRGESLQARIAAGPIPWQRACIIGAQVADALAAAHTAGIVHRDLKPDNVVLESREDGPELVKVLDFGVARMIADEGSAPEEAAPKRVLTRLGAVVGTPGYMAPEQAVGDALDHRADLYALGILLWEMIVGRMLFPERDLTAIAVRQFTEAIPSVIEQARDTTVPVALDELVRSLLSPTPDARPQTAAGLRDSLRRIARDSTAARMAPMTIEVPSGAFPLDSLDVDPTVRTGPPPMIGRVSPSNAPTRIAEAARRPRRFVPVALGVAGIVAIVVAMFFALSGDAEDRRDPGAAPTPPPRQRVAQELESQTQILLTSNERGARRAAAEWILARDGAVRVPPVVTAVAQLEYESGCPQRNAALHKIAESRDRRALPALRRLRRQPRSGCGPEGDRDCYGCIRANLDRALDAIEE